MCMCVFMELAERGDIPEQLAAYSAQALSTALFMLGTHFAAG